MQFILRKKKTNHRGYGYPLFYAGEDRASTFTSFRKLTKNSKERQKRHLLFAVGLMLTRLMTTIADYYKAFSLSDYFSKPQE